MPTRFSVNINMGNAKNDGESKRAECQNVCDVLERIAQAIMANQASGTVYDRNGLAHTFTYTPTASA